MSDHHEFNWEAFHRDTAGIIARYGRTIIGVGGGDAGEPPFSYSIGNHLKGLPELLIIGSCQAPYLNEMSRLMIARGRPFDEGVLVKTLTLLLPSRRRRLSGAVGVASGSRQHPDHAFEGGMTMHPKSFSEHAERIARRGRSFVGVFDPTLLTISFICASWQWSARRISPQEGTA